MRGAWAAPTGQRRRGAIASACGLAAVVGVAVAPLTSQASPKRQKVDQSFSVKTASGVGTVTSASLVAAFPLPSGVPATKGCKGKVAASAKVSGKTKTWSGKLTAVGTGCTATIKVKLGKSALGKSVTLTFTFAGNTKLAPFKTKQSLVIATPAPKPVPPAPQNDTTTQPAPSTATPPASIDTTPAQTTPAQTTPAQTTPAQTTPTGPPGSPLALYSKGTWASDASDEHGVVFSWTVLSDGTIPGMQSNNFKWNCGTELAPDIVFAKLWFQGGLSAGIDGSVAGSYHYVSDDGKTDVNFTAKFKMTDNAVSGNMTASGSYDYGANGIKGCHTTETFTGYHYGPIPK